MKRLLHIHLHAFIFIASFALCLTSCTTKTDRDRAALETAISDADVQKFKELADSSCDLSSPDRYGNHLTPLMWAVHYEQREMISYLLKKGVDVNQKDRQGWTALIYAVFGGDQNADLVELLVKNGADVNAKDKHGVGALSYARAKPPAPEIIKILQQAGARE